MKKYIKPEIYAVHIAASSMLASSTLDSSAESESTTVTMGGQNTGNEEFTVKSSHVQWDDWE